MDIKGRVKRIWRVWSKMQGIREGEKGITIKEYGVKGKG